METRELAIHYIISEFNIEDELRMRLAYALDSDILDRIYDLLEEYGEENDLPEGWWEIEGSIEDDWFNWVFDAIDWDFKYHV